MLSETCSQMINTQGRLSGLKDANSVEVVSDFIKSHLSYFANENKGSALPENSLTQHLLRLLNSICIKQNIYFPFYFDKEDIQDEVNAMSPRVDVGVISTKDEGVVIGVKRYSNRESFFSVEAKILNSNFPAQREKEYLIGYYDPKAKKYKDTGGVERFKKLIHGKNLSYAGIIAYITSEDISYWENKIDTWLSELISASPVNDVRWESSDKLSIIEKDRVKAFFQSKNSRKDDYITLRHFWVMLHNNHSSV